MGEHLFITISAITARVNTVTADMATTYTASDILRNLTPRYQSHYIITSINPRELPKFLQLKYPGGQRKQKIALIFDCNSPHHLVRKNCLHGSRVKVLDVPEHLTQEHPCRRSTALDMGHQEGEGNFWINFYVILNRSKQHTHPNINP